VRPKVLNRGIRLSAVSLFATLATMASQSAFGAPPTGAPPTLSAADAPDVITLPSGLNLGLSSFYDGFTPVEPGSIALVDYFKYEHLNEITDSQGNPSPAFNHPRVDAQIDVLQFIWVSPVRIGAGVLGFTILQPVVNIDSHFDTPGVVLNNNGFDAGDTIFGPYYQSEPIISGGRPVFSYRIEFDTSAPDGGFDPHRNLDQSSGYWSIIPYAAFTWLPTPALEISARLHYLYNFQSQKAPNPPPIPGFDFQNGQAGQAAWANFDASYAVAPHLSLGVNGFYLKQFTDDSVNGQSLLGTEKQELYLGPGIHIPFDKMNKNILNVNAYFPIETRGLPQGTQITAQFIHVF
jgi:hypothetical protein